MSVDVLLAIDQFSMTWSWKLQALLSFLVTAKILCPCECDGISSLVMISARAEYYMRIAQVSIIVC